MSRFHGIIACFALVISLAPVAAAETSIDAPKLGSGDSWTYEDTKEVRGKWQQTRDVITVERASPSSIAVDLKVAGSDQPPREQLVGPDWSPT